jgi:hypothetical protein
MGPDDLDDIVQALAVAKYALEANNPDAAAAAIDDALARARRLMTAQRPAGDLVRGRPAPSRD